MSKFFNDHDKTPHAPFHKEFGVSYTCWDPRHPCNHAPAAPRAAPRVAHRAAPRAAPRVAPRAEPPAEPVVERVKLGPAKRKRPAVGAYAARVPKPKGPWGWKPLAKRKKVLPAAAAAAATTTASSVKRRRS